LTDRGACQELRGGEDRRVDFIVKNDNALEVRLDYSHPLDEVGLRVQVGFQATLILGEN